jgi:hypothetical protein
LANSAPPPDPKGRLESRPSSLAPEALAGLGKLRECVAAARNLEHLIGSRDVGPKVLVQVVPEVATELEPLSQAVADVYEYVTGALRLPENSLVGIVDIAQTTSKRLIDSLRENAKAKFDARHRLSVERNIRASLPPLSATLGQIELLVETTSYTPVPMSVGELLSSAPDTGSNRPKRVVSLSGDVDEFMVSIPARIGLRCLSMVAAALMAAGRPSAALQAERNGNQIELTFGGPFVEGERTAEIPVCPHAQHNLEAVAVALGHFECRLLPNMTGISLPER